jgi:hypothetical protein
VRPETALQRSMRAHLLQRGYAVVHVPNGAVLAGDPKRRAIQMISLLKDGLCLGFPDLLVYGQAGQIGHIEVKTEGEFANDNQMAVEQWLSERGQVYAVCRSLEDIDETLVRWGWV